MNGVIPATLRDRPLSVSEVYAPAFEKLHEAIRLRTRLRILVVVDGGIELTEAPSAFGVGRVIRLLRESSVGCTRFTVDTARRNGSTAGSPTYTGFRFDRVENGRPVLDKYDEVWCFGFNPDNFGQSDANITQPGALPTSDDELKALTTWMNERRGGLLAMGDHDYLGASMCHRIPRIRSMRRWTNAQGVPPIDGYLRHDTNQPATAAEQAGTAEIDFLNQEDAVPQRIDWVPWITQRQSVLQVKVRPHPILCHPTHGPIDVLPDHPHEGWLYEDHEIDLGATYSFAGLSGPEYPTVNGVQPAPMLIAHGTTTPDPPFDLEKGPSPKKRFGQIGVYDGHRANVGRVVTDATWHHWFDENVQDIEAAGGVHWDKISRYFLNVATWLAPPGKPDLCFALDLVQTHFTYLGFQEYNRRADVLDLGRSVHRYFGRIYGPCWVTQWVIDKIRLVDDDFWAYLEDRLFWKRGKIGPIPPDPCLSCPPFELVEVAVLGGLVKATFDLADEVRAHAEKGFDGLELDEKRLLAAQQEGVRAGLTDLKSALTRSTKQLTAALR